MTVVAANVRGMVVRPTERWRDDSSLPMAGDPACLPLIDEAMQVFETGLAGLDTPSDEQVFELIKQVVRALNTIDAERGGNFDTVDREVLCEYIREALTEAGFDVEALAERRGIGSHEITDEWRDW
jgi:hypothetical protein